jgi:hypothetical protein
MTAGGDLLREDLTMRDRILSMLKAGMRTVDVAAAIDRKPAYIRQVKYKAKNPVSRAIGRRSRGAPAPVMERREALTLGLASYFTGRPCSRGHLAPRQTANSTCSDCSNKDAVARRASDRGTARAKRRLYYQQHLEEERANTRRSYRKFKPARLAAKAQWQRDNPDKVSARSKRWLLRHPEVANAGTARRRAGLDTATPKWLGAAEHAAMRALYARGRAEGREVDHIVPLKGKAVSGLHVPWNLQLLPPRENRSKSNRVEA